MILCFNIKSSGFMWKSNCSQEAHPEILRVKVMMPATCSKWFWQKVCACVEGERDWEGERKEGVKKKTKTNDRKCESCEGNMGIRYIILSSFLLTWVNC